MEFREIAICAIRCFHTFQALVGVGVYGGNSEEAIRKQPISMGGDTSPKWNKSHPITSKPAKLSPDGLWGAEGREWPRDTSMVLTDFAPLGPRYPRIFPGVGRKGEMEDSEIGRKLTHVGRAMELQCLVYGAVYGDDHVSERLLSMQYLAHLRYSYETLCTPDLLDQAWGEMPPVYQGA